MTSKLKQNIIYNALYRMLVILLPLITTPYLVRVLSKEQIGLNSYTLSIIQIFVILSFWGINNYASREIASKSNEQERNEEFWSIWIIQILFSIISFIVFNICIFYILNKNRFIFFIQSFLIIINMIEVSWFFVGIEELKRIVLRNTTIKLLATLAIFILVKNNNDFYLYITINVISTLAGNIVLINSLRTYINYPNLNKNKIIYHIKNSWKFLIPQFSILIYTSLDKVILGNLSSMEQVAYYDQSQKIIRISVALISSIGIALLPRITHIVKNNKIEEFENIITKSLSNVLLISIYIVTGIICVAPSFVSWFFSDEYTNITLLMQLVAPIGIFIPIATILWNTILIPMRLDNIAIKSAVYCAIMSFGINFLLDSRLGALGAIITLLIVEFFGMMYRIYYSKKFYNFAIIIPNIKKYIVASFIICSFMTVLNNYISKNIYTTIFISIIVSIMYFGILIFFKDTLVHNYMLKIKMFLRGKVLKKLYRKIMEKLSDNQAIKIQYFRTFRCLPNEKNPKTFSEKIHFIKISDWLETKSQFVDKYKVREFIKDKIGEEYLVNLLGVYESVEEIDFSELPNSFVIKLNNGSGFNLIVKDKSEININKIKIILSRWLISDFYRLSREKQYKNVKQVLICEEYLEDNSGELKDYKFFCFDGKFKFVQVDTGRFSEHVQNFYDNDWNKLDFTYISRANIFLDEKPERYEEMIELSEKLSSGFPFVRVDFYYVNSKIYFGELTFTPNNGMKSIKPIEKDLEIASWIDIEKYK